MRRFLKDIFIIMLLIVLGCLALECAISKVPNEFSVKYNYLLTNMDSIETLILGHSQVEGGINPHTYAPRAYNMAHRGAWIYYDMKLVQQIVPNMKNIHTIIYSMGYDFPWGFLSPHYQLNPLSKEYIFYHARYMHIRYDRFPDNIIYSSALLTNHLKFSNFMEATSTRDSLGFDHHDYQIHLSDWWQDASKVHVDNIGDSSLYKYVDEYTDCLKEIAKVCMENEVRLVVVTTPCYKTYLRDVTPEGVSTCFSIIEKVKKDYPIEYYHYLDDSDFRSDSLYYDCSHLNYFGAEVFTERLKRDMLHSEYN